MAKTLKQKQELQAKEREAYEYFISQGWSPEQSVGITGNLIHESNLNTTILGTADDKGSQGLAQWHSGRLSTLKKKYGKSWTDFKNQLEFVDWELKNTEKRAGDKLKNSKSALDAGLVVSDHYERPKIKFSADKRRQSHVMGVASRLGGKNLLVQQEPLTNDINYFDFQTQTPIFAGVPESSSSEEEKIVEKDVKEVEKQTKEYNFLDELQNLQNNQVSLEQPQQIAQQVSVPQTDFMQQYEQISQFVDNDVAQQGGTWVDQQARVKAEKNNKLKKLLEINRENNFVKELIETPKERNTQILQRDNTNVVKKNTPKLISQETRNKTAQERKGNITYEDAYKNPEKLEGISSGDDKLDFLYKNDWLIDVPFVGKYIKNKAKEVAEKSQGSAIVDIEDLNGSYDGDSSDKEEGLKRATLLDQYFSKEPILDKAKYKPIDDYYEFLPTYSVKGNFDELYSKNEEIKKKFNKVLSEDIVPKNMYNQFIKSKKPIYASIEDGGSLANLIGADLGGHKVGVAWDKTKNLPYLSISDAWDFEPTHYSKKWRKNTLEDTNENESKNEEKAFIEAFLMHKVGNPYKIYDRFYFNPETKEYIQDSELNKQQGGKYSQGELNFLSEIAIKDNNGYWNPENQGKIVEISSPNISMKNVKQELLGISKETGEKKIMKSGKEYSFKNTKNVIEVPFFKK